MRSAPHNVGALLSEEEEEEETTLPTCSAVGALQRTALKGEVVSMILYKKPPPFTIVNMCQYNNKSYVQRGCMAYVTSQCHVTIYIATWGQASMALQWNGAYCQSLSAVARARYESKVLQAGLGIVSYSIDYLTPAVLYFARNRQMVQERTLHTLAGGRKELYMSDRIKHLTIRVVCVQVSIRCSLLLGACSMVCDNLRVLFYRL